MQFIHLSQKEIAAARQVSVYDYLTERHRDDVILEGNCLRLRKHHGIVARKSEDFPGYFDNRTGRPENGITLLTKYYGYSFPDAVNELLTYEGQAPTNEGATAPAESAEPVKQNDIKEQTFPEPYKGQYRRLFAYLMKRGFPQEVIQRLVDQGLLYEDVRHNAVFINSEKSYAEAKGTTYKPFKRCYKRRGERSFWCIPDFNSLDVVYITESAIDAVSLSVLHKKQGVREGVYVSIGGTGNRGTVETIMESGKKVVIAVDNDAAGQAMRDRYKYLDSIIPENKDWNDDLKKSKGE